MRVFQTIKKVINVVGGGGGINFRSDTSWGLEARTRLRAVVGRGDVGVSASQSPTAVTVRQQPTVAVERVSVGLGSLQWCDVASESAASDWNDVPNFASAPDGAVATLQEGLTLVQGTLIGDFPDFVGKSNMTITRVRLRFHYRVSEFLLAGSNLSLQYRIGPLGTPTTMKSVSGGVIEVVNEDHLVAGETFDITADRTWTWTDLNDMQALCNGIILVDAGLANVEADAVLLLVDATAEF